MSAHGLVGVSLGPGGVPVAVKVRRVLHTRVRGAGNAVVALRGHAHVGSHAHALRHALRRHALARRSSHNRTSSRRLAHGGHVSHLGLTHSHLGLGRLLLSLLLLRRPNGLLMRYLLGLLTLLSLLGHHMLGNLLPSTPFLFVGLHEHVQESTARGSTRRSPRGCSGDCSSKGRCRNRSCTEPRAGTRSKSSSRSGSSRGTNRSCSSASD